MFEKIRWNLQAFAEGGDGPTAGGETGGTEGMPEVPAGIPERAKKTYQAAVAKTNRNTVKQNNALGIQKESKTVQTEETNVSENSEVTVQGELEKNTPKSFEELIQSEDYREAYQQNLERQIARRLKGVDSVKADNTKMRQVLETVAGKYGLDIGSDTFLDDIVTKVGEDNSYYEQYAEAHDMSTKEAKHVLELERRLQMEEARKREEEKQNTLREQIATLQKNADQTKQRFPGFQLETEMQDERFRRMCAVSNGDTTAAYIACHWDDIMKNTVTQAQTAAKEAAQTAVRQTVNAVAANKARPLENGITGGVAATAEPDFSKMSLTELRAYADEQRRRKR